MITSKIISNIRKRLLELSAGVYSDDDLLVFANQSKDEIQAEIQEKSRLKETTLTFANGEANIPDDFYSHSRSWLGDRWNEYKWVSPEIFDELRLPQMICRIGNKIKIYPADTASLTTRYYIKTDDLTNAEPAKEPNLHSYLHEAIIFGAISRALEVSKDYSESAIYEAKFRDRLERAKIVIVNLEAGDGIEEVLLHHNKK